MAVKHYRLTWKHELPVKITMKIQEISKYMYMAVQPFVYTGNDYGQIFKKVSKSEDHKT